MELRQYFDIVRKWFWLVLLSVSIAAGSSFMASRAATPLYTTKTTLMVGRVTQNPDPSAMEINTGQQLAQTYTQLTRREPVLKGAIDALGLDMNWEALAYRVRANVIPQTNLVEISVIDNDPYRAKLLADTIAQQLILQSPTTPDNLSQEQVAFTQLQLDELKAKIENAQQESARLNQELDAANSARLIQDLQNQINVLDTKMNNWQYTYSQLLVSMQGGMVNALTVIEEATLPTKPFSPDIQKNVLLATVIGLILAVGGIFLIEYLDDTIKTPEELTRVTELPTMGTIARIDGQGYSDKLIALRMPLSPVVEAFRVLRTNLQFSSLDRPIKTLMITSPGPSEGKSVTLSNLAVVLAQSGLNVILVDADLRRPTQHKIFDISNRTGLTDVIVNPDPFLEERLQKTEIDKLRILPSGAHPPNPAELLGSERMRETIKKLETCADIILIDSPPTLMFADAAILGTRVDGMLIVVDSGKTRRNDARKGAETLRRVKANLLGVVLNRSPVGAGGYYTSYYSDYQVDTHKNGHKPGLRWPKRRSPQLNTAAGKRDK